MAPPARYYEQLYDYARSHGLSRKAGRLYATLTWWGAHYQLPPPPIVSGKRSAARQRELRAEWDRYGSRGPNRLVTRPATDSTHTLGEAFDLARVEHLWIYGAWAAAAGGRWGGSFRDRDDVHFDTGAL